MQSYFTPEVLTNQIEENEVALAAFLAMQSEANNIESEENDSAPVNNWKRNRRLYS